MRLSICLVNASIAVVAAMTAVRITQCSDDNGGTSGSTSGMFKVIYAQCDGVDHC